MIGNPTLTAKFVRLARRVHGFPVQHQIGRFGQHTSCAGAGGGSAQVAAAAAETPSPLWRGHFGPARGLQYRLLVRGRRGGRGGVASAGLLNGPESRLARIMGILIASEPEEAIRLWQGGDIAAYPFSRACDRATAIRHRHLREVL